jgi:integrase
MKKRGSYKRGIYPRGNVYWYKFQGTLKHPDGRREPYQIIESAHTSDRQEAEDRRDEHRRAIRDGKVHPNDSWPPPKPEEPKTTTLREYSQTFLDGVEKKLGLVKDEFIREQKTHTFKFYKNGVKRLLQWPRLFAMDIRDITTETATHYANWRRQTSPKESICAVNSDLRTLRRILHCASEVDEVAKVPRIHEIEGASIRERVISPDEERRYFAAATPTLHDVGILAVDLGPRPPSELFPLRWQNVYLENTRARFGYIHIAEGKTKAARRNIPLSERARDMLLARKKKARAGSKYVFPGSGKKGHLMSIQHAHERTIRRVQKADKASKREPLEAFEFYCWRHTFATRRAQSGMDRYTLARLMGHSSPSVTDRYYTHVEDSHVTAQHEEFLRRQEMIEAAEKQASESEKNLAEVNAARIRRAQSKGSSLIQ